MTADALTRRDCLALLATGTAGLAGCSGGDNGSPNSSPTDPGTEPATTSTAEPDGESTSLVARPVGLVAEYDPDGGTASEAQVRAAVADAMPGVPERDIQVDGSAGIVEVRADGDAVNPVAGLVSAGYEADADDVRAGVTDDTWTETREAIADRLAVTGYENATVTTATGDGRGVRVAVPGWNRTAIADLLADRGRVRIVAASPTETEDGETSQRRETVVTPEGMAEVGSARAGTGAQPPSVTVTLDDATARSLVETLVDRGFTDEGVGDCRWQTDREDPGYCLYTVLDGEVTYAAGLSPALAEAMRGGEFVEDPTFILTAEDLAAAEQLEYTLEAGALPVPLDLDGGT